MNPAVSKQKLFSDIWNWRLISRAVDSKWGGSTLVDQILDGLDGKTTIRWRLIQRRFLLLVDYQKLWERGQIDRKYDRSIDRPKSVRLPLIENVYTMTEQRMLYVCTQDRNTRYIRLLAEILVLWSKRAATQPQSLIKWPTTAFRCACSMVPFYHTKPPAISYGTGYACLGINA